MIINSSQVIQYLINTNVIITTTNTDISINYL